MHFPKCTHPFRTYLLFEYPFSKPKMLTIMKFTLFLTSCWLAVAGLFNTADKTILNGTVTDNAGKAIARATVNVLKNKTLVKSAATDVEGKFNLELEPGTYDVEAARAGFVAIRYTEIVVKQGVTSSVLFQLTASTSTLDEVVVTGYHQSVARDALMSSDIAYSSDDRAATAPLGATHTKRKSAPAAKSAAPAPVPMSATPEKSDFKRSRGDYSGPPSTAEPVMTEMLVAPTEPREYAAKAERYEDLGEREMDKTIPGGPTSTTPTPRAGLLTAGEWNDLHNWNRHWVDLLTDGEISAFQKTYQCFPSQRYTVLLTNAEDFPVADAYVKLTTGSGDMLWESRTDNSGKAELWAGFFDQKEYANLRAEVWIDGRKEAINTLKPAKTVSTATRYRWNATRPKKWTSSGPWMPRAVWATKSNT